MVPQRREIGDLIAQPHAPILVVLASRHSPEHRSYDVRRNDDDESRGGDAGPGLKGLIDDDEPVMIPRETGRLVSRAHLRVFFRALTIDPGTR